ncbi:UNVERIFIED_CONTAM: putative ribonuclease H protein [Sesamum latifolium]|uniref:Ribonuclease H protein n=1 Tax=Sesamum latifolium TaxID=2727402 RepID=A0AAW2U1D2_9LAMI
MKSECALRDFFTVNSLHIPLQPKAQRQKIIIVNWRKPQEGWYKLNTDGASKGNPGIFDAGGILRDHLGRVIFAFQEPLGNTTNTQAELRAFHRGLKIYTDMGFHNIWIETDATASIKLISTLRQGAWNLQTTLQNIRKLLSQMEYKISHVFREENQATDFLANQACTTQHLGILSEDGLTVSSGTSIEPYSWSVSWKCDCIFFISAVLEHQGKLLLQTLIQPCCSTSFGSISCAGMFPSSFPPPSCSVSRCFGSLFVVVLLVTFWHSSCDSWNYLVHLSCELAWVVSTFVHSFLLIHAYLYFGIWL